MLPVVPHSLVVISLYAFYIVFPNKINHLIHKGRISAQIAEVVYLLSTRCLRRLISRLQGLNVSVYVSEYRNFHIITLRTLIRRTSSKCIGSLDPAIFNAEIGALKIPRHIYQTDQHRHLDQWPDDCCKCSP